MNYAVTFHPALRKDLKRIAPKAREEIISRIIPQLAINPFIGVRLVGPLRDYWKQRIFISGVWYRMAYALDVSKREVIIVAIGPRGGFYNRLRHRLHT